MASDLVVKLGRCKYLSIMCNKRFCGLDPMVGQLWVRARHGVLRFNRENFDKIPEIDPKNCTPQCLNYTEAEKFLPRVIKERKKEKKRAFRLW